MDELRKEIERLTRAIAEYDRLIPHMPQMAQANARFHRNWDAQILADYQRAIVHA